jgi:hypothetical protein
MMRQAFIYGLVAFAAIFFVGWSTGMGGSFWPNVGFSALMGVFAALCYIGALKIAGRTNGDKS